MQQMMVRAFLVLILAQLSPVTSYRKESSEKTDLFPSHWLISEFIGHDSSDRTSAPAKEERLESDMKSWKVNAGSLKDKSAFDSQTEYLKLGWPQKTDTEEPRSSQPAVYCDSESLTIGLSSAQHTDLYILIDDKLKVFVKHVLEQCSHVELQPASMVRIFYEECYLQDWVGHRKQYSVKIGYSDSILKKLTITSETCPSATNGALMQVPAVTCASADTTVELPAKVLKDAGFQELDASLSQNNHMSQDLTQWRNRDHLFIKVKNPRTKL
ncbi:uncharacterized protein LOC113590152 [Electrophorus electricus]|uniref:uncharacterized protein LOC113590152 n=1 Tax=Electrophorus electricus TaxID=8005 RepID=UPI0015D03CCF|nr:uncharacterized protein LOC113590152 [Electrophorus electricus]